MTGRGAAARGARAVAIAVALGVALGVVAAARVAAAEPQAAGPAAVTPAPPEAATLAIDPADAAAADAIAARLAGQRFTIAADRASVRVDDVAGLGAPWVGVIERRGDALVLVPAAGPALRLEGPLARPRLAGPGYAVWAVGAVRGDALAAVRLGVLRRPAAAPAR